MSAPPVTQTAPPMVQYVNGPGYADPYNAPAPSYLDYGYPSFDPSYGFGSEPGIHDYGYDTYPLITLGSKITVAIIRGYANLGIYKWRVPLNARRQSRILM